MLKTDKIMKGDLVARKYVGGPMLDKQHGVVLRLDRWLPSGDVKARVHFIGGFVRVLNPDRLEKLNK